MLIICRSKESFERELAKDAARYKRRVRRAQQAFDEKRESDRSEVLRRIEEADARMYRHPPRFK
jgi:phage shock protein A